MKLISGRHETGPMSGELEDIFRRARSACREMVDLLTPCESTIGTLLTIHGFMS